ncbi:unnamed protein product [Blepharisma stoltei]|uniref:FUN14 family protein n=1 Tax=Blepharisma stoltei TaxID=1481888 RepID=A0AAU9J803_9CILI|nr:unnamed protein product [Blepharisma stoltei]
MSGSSQEDNKSNAQENQDEKESCPAKGIVFSLGVGFTSIGIFKKVSTIFAYGMMGAFAFYQLLNHYGYASVNWSELYHKIKGDLNSSELVSLSVKEFHRKREGLKITLEKVFGFIIGSMIGFFIF